MLTPSSEVFLSYLTGLAPVGEPIEPRLETTMADLGYRQKVSIYRCLGELIRAGCVRKIAGGSGGTIGVLIVAVRLENLAELHLKKDVRRGCDAAIGFGVDDEADDDAVGSAGCLSGRVSQEDWFARLAEIPDDTRDLTARVLGDPIPNDKRRRQLQVPTRRAISVGRAASPGEAGRKAVA